MTIELYSDCQGIKIVRLGGHPVEAPHALWTSLVDVPSELQPLYRRRLRQWFSSRGVRHNKHQCLFLLPCFPFRRSPHLADLFRGRIGPFPDLAADETGVRPGSCTTSASLNRGGACCCCTLMLNQCPQVRYHPRPAPGPKPDDSSCICPLRTHTASCIRRLTCKSAAKM